jgi:hypothetical protein
MSDCAGAGALSELDKCIELNGTYANYYSECRILHLTRIANIRQALRSYNRAIDVDLAFGRAYFARGLFYDDLYHDSEKACADVKKAKNLGYFVDDEKYVKYCKYYVIVQYNLDIRFILY